MKRIGIVGILIALLIVFNGCLNISITSDKKTTDDIVFVSDSNTVGDGNAVHFIDVGQGDSILAVSNGECMLIDAGEEDQGEVVVDYINKLGVECLKYVVATHPHSDHIGGMDDVINNINVQNIIMPDVVTTTKCFENMLDAVENNNVNAIKAVSGDSFKLGNFDCKIFGPINESDNLNNNSVVIMMVCGNDKILLTGDCSKDEEMDIIKSGADISADILKVGHHGSSTSNCNEFISAINPDIAVISCGKNNSYGHPHTETMDILEKYNTDIYRTDEMGTVIACCSGNGITMKYGSREEIVEENSRCSTDNISEEIRTLDDSIVENNPTDDVLSDNTYILNIKSKKYHKTDCGSAGNIKNKEEFTGSSDELKVMGYTPCGLCNPE